MDLGGVLSGIVECGSEDGNHGGDYNQMYRSEILEGPSVRVELCDQALTLIADKEGGFDLIEIFMDCGKGGLAMVLPEKGVGRGVWLDGAGEGGYGDWRVVVAPGMERGRRHGATFRGGIAKR